MQLTRKIILEGYEVAVSIGIHDFERAAPQRVIIDVELTLATVFSGVDEIGHVLDYDFLRQEIQALVRDRHFNLQETLCNAIVTLCAARDGVARVRVRTRKPDVYADCAFVGYEEELVVG